MYQDHYLKRYYKNNNPLLSQLTIRKRIFKRLWIFIITSVLYFIMISFSNFGKLSGELTIGDTLSILHYMMVASACIGGIGLIVMVLFYCQKDLLKGLSYQIKSGIFTFLDWFSVLPICIFITIFCFSYLFIITPVSGTSMMPTIEDGEHVFVLYHQKIEHGSVVILEVNEEDNFDVRKSSHYIKRVVGCPGDTVEWKNKQLIINGQVVEESYFPDDYLTSLITTDFEGPLRYKDEKGQLVETARIPEGYYFVLGDNRSIGGSHDSRAIGLIPEKNIIGVATYHMRFIIPRGKIV